MERPKYRDMLLELLKELAARDEGVAAAETRLYDFFVRCEHDPLWELLLQHARAEAEKEE